MGIISVNKFGHNQLIELEDIFPKNNCVWWILIENYKIFIKTYNFMLPRAYRSKTQYFGPLVQIQFELYSPCQLCWELLNAFALLMCTSSLVE